eukprot:TRINITY_DN1147_c3_g1_i2.p1 TRINITY_DN1147_c3_g1~~TRINITY_DN1147_c3_g1_i2.p1  ORF type:complete len:736 (-),score=115.27 TRINITY_DN1147_c3_g1_i2:335-2422(-)
MPLERKVLYCSRTHSQLTQFAGEVKCTAYASQLRLVPLASRRQLCINPQVAQLSSLSRVNDACLDLLKAKKGKCAAYTRIHDKTGGCVYYSDEAGRRCMRDHILAKVQDIEEVVSLGKKLCVCPYYAARKAIKSAQMVLLPYQLLFHKPSREWLGIDVKDNIVVIDEAHNLIDAINNIHSVELNLAQLERARFQLGHYLDTYSRRLNPKNIVYIKQILFIVDALRTTLTSPPPVAPSDCELKSVAASLNGLKPVNKAKPAVLLLTINDFIFSAKIDNYNVFKLERYFERSKIAFKVSGFHEKVTPSATAPPGEVSTDDDLVGRHRPALGQVESFLLALSNADRNGRVLVTYNAETPQASSLRFLLLNPEAHFRDVIEQAKAVVLAGGTLQPMSSLRAQLLSGAATHTVHQLSCGHVIPPSNVVVVPLARGPSGLPLDFTYASRSSPDVIAELGRTLTNLCRIVPDGVVCFFPSYKYEDAVVSAWEQTGVTNSIAARKKIFVEPKDTTAVDVVLRQYKSCIKHSFSNKPGTPAGALLCAVVGGKMSEGINFSDGLARCVVVVGMPYPNPQDPVLVEKMCFLETLSRGSGTAHYEELCMKAVNQSIGRAIRHAQDYAVIVLIDRRYGRSSTLSKLPTWLTGAITKVGGGDRAGSDGGLTFGPAFSAVARFFQGKRAQQEAAEHARAVKHSTKSYHKL